VTPATLATAAEPAECPVQSPNYLYLTVVVVVVVVASDGDGVELADVEAKAGEPASLPLTKNPIQDATWRLLVPFLAC